MRAHHWASALSARNVFCSGHSGGTANHLESKCAYLKPLLLLFNERVITYMKTVVWKSSVCTAEQLRYTVGNWALLWVSVCEQKLQQSFLLFGQPYRSHISVYIGGLFWLYGHLKHLAAYRGECVCRRKGKRKGYIQERLRALLGLHGPLLNFSPALWAQPERTLSRLRLSRILSMLGNNILLAAFFDLSENVFPFCASVKSKAS